MKCWLETHCTRKFASLSWRIVQGKHLEKKCFWSINPDTTQNRLVSTPDSDRLEHLLNI